MRMAMPVWPGSLASSTRTPGDETFAVHSVRTSKSSSVTPATGGPCSTAKPASTNQRPRILHPASHIQYGCSNEGSKGSRVQGSEQDNFPGPGAILLEPLDPWTPGPFIAV